MAQTGWQGGVWRYGGGEVDLELKKLNQERMGRVHRNRIPSYASTRRWKAAEGGAFCACTDHLAMEEVSYPPMAYPHSAHCTLS